jgi:RNA polymerase sigma-70 factor (ECF subfamily)
MPKTKITYRELAENFVATRSEKDYNAIYSRVKPGLKTYIYKIVKDNQIANDLTSNVLIKLWTKIDQYKPEWQITTWLYKIAFNEALGYIKERNKKSSLDQLREFGVQVGDDGIINGSANGLLMEYEQKTENDYIEEDEELMQKYESALKAIIDLKPMYKEIMEDRLLKGMKYEDISAKHKVNLQTVKNRIRRGKTLIAEKIS